MNLLAYSNKLRWIILAILWIGVLAFASPTKAAVMPASQIILPDNGTITVNFISTGGPGDRTTCTGDFGLATPDNILIYPDYLYFAGVSFPIDKVFTKDTELVFYIDVHPGSVCADETYFSNDPNRAIIEHPSDNRWIIKWEDWRDADFNDLVVEIVFEKSWQFFDLPFDYSNSNFVEESKDTEQEGRVNAYFDHQYPTYCKSPNVGCGSGDLRAVNFYGYDGGDLEHNQPPYNVQYNGHDGIDYVGDGISVLAVAPGEVIFRGKIATKCGDGITREANVVKVKHPNGYVTEYWHLGSFGDGIFHGVKVIRSTSQPLGTMGQTGCVTGPHLHLLVRNPEGVVVDPYGWQPKPDAAWYGKDDPWQVYNAQKEIPVDAISHYLWVHNLKEDVLINHDNETIVNSPAGKVTASFPIGVYHDPLRIELAESLASADLSGYNVSGTFSVFGYTVGDQVVTELDDTYELRIDLGLSAQSTLINKPKLFIWDVRNKTWQELENAYLHNSAALVVHTNLLGTFAVGRVANVHLPMIWTDSSAPPITRTPTPIVTLTPTPTMAPTPTPTMTPTPTPPTGAFVWWEEVENGELIQPIGHGHDNGASSCGYIYTTDDWSNGGARLEFDLPSSGNYYIWARAMGFDWSSNSFFISIDGGQDYQFEILPRDDGSWNWEWKPAPPPDEYEDPVWLSAGRHTIRFKSRENAARLDAVLITNDPNYTPTEFRTCNDTQTPTPTLTVTHTPTPSPTFTPTQTSTPTSTMAPTPTPTMTSTPTPPTGTFVWWEEVENGELIQPIGHGHDNGASSCGYIYTTDDWSNGGARLEFDLPSSGNYYIWARAMGFDWSSNSFFISIDGGQDYQFEILPRDDGSWEWEWKPAPPPDEYEDPVWLSAGRHTIRFKSRENAARLDAVLITDDPNYTPTEFRDCK